MSIQNALSFIGKCRRSDKIARQVSNVKSDLNEVVEIGAKEGYSFSKADLRDAFKQDWAMRWFKQSHPR